MFIAVTCHLHFWHNDFCYLLRATAVTLGWNRYRNKSLNILPVLLPGPEPATCRTHVRRPTAELRRFRVTNMDLASRVEHQKLSIQVTEKIHRPIFFLSFFLSFCHRFSFVFLLLFLFVLLLLCFVVCLFVCSACVRNSMEVTSYAGCRAASALHDTA